MGHPSCRTWTLGTLDREQPYRLWFDPSANRWEVRPEGQDDGTLTTRAMTTDDRGALRPQRSGERGAAGRRHAQDGTGAGGLTTA